MQGKREVELGVGIIATLRASEPSTMSKHYYEKFTTLSDDICRYLPLMQSLEAQPELRMDLPLVFRTLGTWRLKLGIWTLG